LDGNARLGSNIAAGFYLKKGVAMVELERELTFLIERLPKDLEQFPSKIIEDNYVPADADHPIIRIRRNGDKFVITKKHPVDAVDGGAEGDSSRQVEHTIELTHAEYQALNAYDGKRFKKRRFAYQTDGYPAELDIYLDALSGLAVIDFEFDSDEAMKKFVKPSWVGADISQETLTAGGILAGKTYADIGDELLRKYDYKPISEVEKYDEDSYENRD
jgi:CYTH domain-containing protein